MILKNLFVISQTSFPKLLRQSYEVFNASNFVRAQVLNHVPKDLNTPHFNVPTKILTEVEYVCLDFSKFFAECDLFYDKKFDGLRCEVHLYTNQNLVSDS